MGHDRAPRAIGAEPGDRILMSRRASITRDTVVDAALEIIDVDGVGGLSLEAIASRLGVRGPSLYYHFSDKSEILDAIAARVIGDLDVRSDADDWQEWLVQRAVQFQVRVMQHPGAASLLMEHLNPRAAEIGFAKAARLLDEAGIPVAIQNQILLGAQHIAWGATLYRAFVATHPPVPVTTTASMAELVAAREADPDAADGLAALATTIRSFLSGVLASINDQEHDDDALAAKSSKESLT